MEWFKMMTIWGAPLEKLSDNEAGRFIKAVFAYVRDGKKYDGSGREELLVCQALETLKDDLEKYANAQAKANDAREAISQKRREAAMKRWKANGCKPMQTDANASKSMQVDAGACKSMQNMQFACKNQNQIDIKNNKYSDDDEDDEDNYSAGAREEETEWKSAVETAVEAQCGRKAAPAEIAQIATRAQLFGLSPGMVALAIKTAAENHALNLVKYVTKIFDDWQFEHVTTPEEAEELTAMRFAAKGQGLYVVDSHEDVDRMREARERRKAEHESKAGVG